MTGHVTDTWPDTWPTWECLDGQYYVLLMHVYHIGTCTRVCSRDRPVSGHVTNMKMLVWAVLCTPDACLSHRYMDTSRVTWPTRVQSRVQHETACMGSIKHSWCLFINLSGITYMCMVMWPTHVKHKTALMGTSLWRLQFFNAPFFVIHHVDFVIFCSPFYWGIITGAMSDFCTNTWAMPHANSRTQNRM